ncbi:hypothetical protein [Streptomyces sp. ADI98-10]|uniref:hypothetical protein n=1 Tax=Streptomyces sp. ADI98-10 TaxID=1522763 RepID=UPI0019D1B268
MAMNAMLPTGAGDGGADCTAAPTATTAMAVPGTGVGPTRSGSPPPTGRIVTAGGTEPDMRFAASA